MTAPYIRQGVRPSNGFMEEAFGSEELQPEAVITTTPADSVGAPVEQHNPLGYSVSLTNAILLNVSEMIGVGIYSTPGSILKGVGSVGLFLVYWILGPLIAFAGLTIFNELASMFPKRSGGEVVYLEQAYPRPRFLVPITYAVAVILTSFSATNSIVFAEYFIDALEIQHTAFRQTALAILIASLAMGICCLSTKWSLRIINVVAFIKMGTLLFFVVTGACVLAGLTSVTTFHKNFDRPFEGTTSSGSSIATALFKINSAFVGWAGANKVLGEVRGKDPIRTLRRASYIALGIVSTLYFLVVTSYVMVVPKDEMKESGQLVASAFLKGVYGNTFAPKLLPLLIACSCFGNLVAATTGGSRVVREIARQGILPFGTFFASTRPWGTPLGPILLKYTLTVFVLLASPAKDAFSFLLDVASYPHTVFTAALAAGVWVLRKRRATENLPPPSFRAWNAAVGFYFVNAVFLAIVPWSVSLAALGFPRNDEPNNKWLGFLLRTGPMAEMFLFGTQRKRFNMLCLSRILDNPITFYRYCVVGVGVLASCGIYYYFWIILLPKWGGYEIVEEIVDLPDGARVKRLTRRYHRQPSSTSIHPDEHSPLLQNIGRL
ncbi:hypothetical protein BOTBODRAFT_434059 [Botryobasidium botryosum FD-172 SS1]|uniref:Amino acid permease/ SLC12A domain-containing protein n=1 Tax=Botryobasidium botryosum (strain FD-172 SS1) TaxID=930990 RepID=A0A067MUI5_BOTB1|nr:hypothetical protein BOTBODRAFT_434059 [Botryobasidium botryosum FD-172 SS1]